MGDFFLIVGYFSFYLFETIILYNSFTFTVVVLCCFVSEEYMWMRFLREIYKANVKIAREGRGSDFCTVEIILFTGGELPDTK